VSEISHFKENVRKWIMPKTMIVLLIYHGDKHVNLIHEMDVFSLRAVTILTLFLERVENTRMSLYRTEHISSAK
jgi:hypothetical protein